MPARRSTSPTATGDAEGAVGPATWATPAAGASPERDDDVRCVRREHRRAFGAGRGAGPMTAPSRTARILVVANRTASTLPVVVTPPEAGQSLPEHLQSGLAGVHR